MFDSLSNSLWIALWATVLSLLIGVPAGIGLSARSVKGAPVFQLLLLLPLVIPEIVLAVSFANAYRIFQMRLSFLTVILTHVAFCLSYVTLLVRSRMSRLDPQLVEAAMDLHASERVVFVRVTLPQLIPALIASALIVFTLSIDDYVITSFVAGVGNTTLPLHIYSLAKEGLTPEINAISTLLIVATLGIMLVAHWMQKTVLSRRAATMSCLLLATLLAAPLVWGRWDTGGPVSDELHLFIWSGYLAPDTLDNFERRRHVRVRCDLYDSNEALLAKLESDKAGYDIVVPGDYTVQILRRRSLLARIDRRLLTHFSDNLDPQFLNRPFDRGNEYSVPYIWGMTGIGYRADVVQQPVQSWNILWNPRFEHRIVMLDDMRENFGAALRLTGKSVNSRDPDALQQAKILLERQKPLLQAYNSSNFQELLVSGDAWLVQGWNGQIVKASLENPNIAFAVPGEGSILFVDSFCIPKNAEHKALAHEFIDYMLEARTAAGVMNYTAYAVANRAARPLLKEPLRNHPGLFPDPEVIRRCEMLEDVGSAALIYDRLWTEIKSK